MTSHVIIGPNGALVIPKDVCERLNWRPGLEIEIETVADRAIVRPRQPQVSRGRIIIDEFSQSMPAYDGQPATLEEMDEAIERGRAERWAAKEARSR